MTALRARYAAISQAPWFKRAYSGKSLGPTIRVDCGMTPRLAVPLLALLLAACASAPQAAGDYERETYRALFAAQTAIEQAKAEATTRDEVLAVNAVIAVYNRAEGAFRLWRASRSLSDKALLDVALGELARALGGGQ